MTPIVVVLFFFVWVAAHFGHLGHFADHAVFRGKSQQFSDHAAIFAKAACQEVGAVSPHLEVELAASPVVKTDGTDHVHHQHRVIVKVPLECTEGQVRWTPVRDARRETQQVEALLPPSTVVWLCAAWAALWIVLQRLCLRWIPFSMLGGLLLDWAPGPRKPSWRHLAFNQVYSVLASVTGLAFAMEYCWCWKLDTFFTWRHQVAFAAAVGRWIPLTLEMHSGAHVFQAAPGWMQRIHRCVVAAVFVACLWTQRMSAIGVGGLVFEVPTLMLNVRSGLQDQRLIQTVPTVWVRSMWDVIAASALFFRGGVLALYLVGLVYQPFQYNDVPYVWFWHIVWLMSVVQTLCWYTILWSLYLDDTAQMNATGRTAVGKSVAGADSEMVNADLEETRATSPSNQQNAITAEELGRHRSASSCWISVHGQVYDVTNFLREHPGGAEQLLRHAGADASSAFEGAGHSPAARGRLSDFLVGPLAEDSHSALGGCKHTFGERYSVVEKSTGTDQLLLLLMHTTAACWGLLVMKWTPGRHTLSPVLLGVALTGAISCPLTLMSKRSSRARQEADISRQVSILDMHRCALSIVTVATVVLLSPPRLIVLGGCGAVFVEALREPLPRTSLATPLSWALLLFYLRVPPEAPSDGFLVFDSAFASVCLAAALVTLCRAAPGVLHVASLQQVAGVLRLAGLWGFLVWLMFRLVVVGSSEGASFLEWAGLAQNGEAPTCVAASVGVSALTALVLVTSSSLTSKTTPRATTTWVSLMIALPVAMTELRSLSGLLGGAGLCLLVRHLSISLETAVRAQETYLPSHCRASLYLLDNLRVLIGLFLWFLCSRPAQAFVSWVLPTELKVYAFEMPLTDLDETLEMGVCFIKSGEQVEPGYVVCNVGHIPRGYVHDARATVHASLEIMRELEVDAPGFVSNVLCVLPSVDKHRGCFSCAWRSLRQVNLSVWRSAEDAASWYRRSTAHAHIMNMHRKGELKTFGNLLASLTPSRLHWQRRCQVCSSIAEGLHADHCSSCGGKTFEIPVF